MELSGNKILITGGATGIGRGLTERFLQEGNSVIICGRRKEVLDEMAATHPSIIARICDLTSEKERIGLFEWIASEHSDLNVLVNNAGIQNWMNVKDADHYRKAEEEITINVLAPLHLTSLFLRLPDRRTILNVTSGLSFVPLAKVPVYSATKAFFHSYTLSLRYLLKDDGVEVIEVIPPALNTDLGGKGLHDGQPPVSAFVEAIFEQLKAGRTELTFGFSEMMASAGPDILKATFGRMNP